MQEQNSYPINYRPSSYRDEERDLGFGSVVARESRERLLNQDGSFNVQRSGLNVFSSLSIYHTVISMSWKMFLGLVLLLYFLSNIVFGLIYSSLGAETIVDTSAAPIESVFLRAFFFSVQTFATIGYGTIHPIGLTANFLVAVESYYSLIINALITGVVFARFARPTAQVIFSKVAVIAPYRGIKGLMFRLVNGRNSQLLEVKAQVMIARFIEDDGRITRRFDFLELERERVAFFPLAWTVVHPIDENSPLYGLTLEDLEKTDAEILVLLSATDETFAAVVHTRSSYKPKEIKFEHKFVNMYNKMENDEPISINIKKLSAVEKA